MLHGIGAALEKFFRVFGARELYKFLQRLAGGAVEKAPEMTTANAERAGELAMRHFLFDVAGELDVDLLHDPVRQSHRKVRALRHQLGVGRHYGRCQLRADAGNVPMGGRRFRRSQPPEFRAKFGDFRLERDIAAK